MLHASHPAILKRLKRAHGHLASVMGMIEADRPCIELSRPLQAVENAIANAKRELIHDYIEHGLDDGVGTAGMAAAAPSEFKTPAKYL